ncbi:hypothetical protein D7D52_20770 [Nocardia yunnanensis]|uniref:Uncharacterized protein n=1 Tax=Nocardia yunnanensis TaxID=2382165 RepID=A0A386ZP83_9NOCA|nr:hypothetical protein D7D52_20770 [Nocardia yunnanensis]
MLAQAVSESGRFGHREHVQVTWLALRSHDIESTVALIAEGLRSTARYQGAPQKYHATLSRAWVELIGYHAAEHPEPDFQTFLDRNPALLDKRLLLRFYHSATLADAAARTGWIAPDRNPFPRHRAA